MGGGLLEKLLLRSLRWLQNRDWADICLRGVIGAERGLYAVWDRFKRESRTGVPLKPVTKFDAEVTYGKGRLPQ